MFSFPAETKKAFPPYRVVKTKDASGQEGADNYGIQIRLALNGTITE